MCGYARKSLKNCGRTGGGVKPKRGLEMAVLSFNKAWRNYAQKSSGLNYASKALRKRAAMALVWAGLQVARLCETAATKIAGI